MANGHQTCSRSTTGSFHKSGPKFPEYQLACYVLFDITELILSRKCCHGRKQIFSSIWASQVPRTSICTLYLVGYNWGDRVQEARGYGGCFRGRFLHPCPLSRAQGLDFSQACQFTIFSAPLPALKNLQPFSLNSGRASQSRNFHASSQEDRMFLTCCILTGFVKRNWYFLILSIKSAHLWTDVSPDL